MTTPMRRRLRVDGITSSLHAFRAQPTLHFRLNGVESIFCARLESHHDHGLGVRCADQSPAIAENDASAIDGDDLVAAGEVFGSFLDDTELSVVWAIDANLGSGDEARHVGKELANSLPRRGDDLKQTCCSIQGIVKAVKTLREEHVTRHLAANRCMGLVHFLLDQGMASLPHHWNTPGLLDGFGERLRSFDIEHDRLALAGSSQGVTGVNDEEGVAPDDLTRIADAADPIGVTTERNAAASAISPPGAHEGLQV